MPSLNFKFGAAQGQPKPYSCMLLYLYTSRLEWHTELLLYVQCVVLFPIQRCLTGLTFAGTSNKPRPDRGVPKPPILLRGYTFRQAISQM